MHVNLGRWERTDAMCTHAGRRGSTGSSKCIMQDPPGSAGHEKRSDTWQSAGSVAYCFLDGGMDTTPCGWGVDRVTVRCKGNWMYAAPSHTK